MDIKRIIKAKEYLLEVADSDKSQEIMDVLQILTEIIDGTIKY